MTAIEPVVLVPVKALPEAKSRLRDVLDDATRTDLVRAMLTDVLEAVSGAHAGPTCIVSSDERYDEIARQFRAARLPDAGGGYNAAVLGALRSEGVRAAGAAMIVPADLACATASDIAHAIDALAGAEVVLVGALDGGTGTLGLRPPDAIAPAFGPRSGETHRALAKAAGRELTVLDLPSLARDIDTIDDLLADIDALGAATRAFVAAHGAVLAAGAAHGRR